MPEKQSVDTDEMGVALIANTKKRAPQVGEPSVGNSSVVTQNLAIAQVFTT